MAVPRKGRHGGRRKGAGRKRGTKVQHVERVELDGQTPVHAILKVLPELAPLRRRDLYPVIRRVLARFAHRDTFRVCHFSVQRDELHLIVEPASKKALSSGMGGLKTSFARLMNRATGRSGRAFADRYEARLLTRPPDVRRALVEVLNGWLRHGEHLGHPEWRTDPYSSADFFDAWRAHAPAPPPWIGPEETPPVAEARFPLLTTAWHRYLTIDPRELPDQPPPTGKP
jgi:REP element-mobilizing transposase RayT